MMEDNCPKCGTPLITKTIKKELGYGSIDYPVALVCPKCNWNRDLTGAGYIAPAVEEKKVEEKPPAVKITPAKAKIAPTEARPKPVPASSVSNRLITVALAILVLGGIVWAFYSTAPKQAALGPSPTLTPVITATPAITETPVSEVTPTGIKKPVELDRRRGFIPSVETTKVGGEIVWTNDGTDRLTLVSSDGLFEDKLLDNGKRTNYTFKKPGMYSFYLKENKNLNGTIVVEP